MGNYKNINYHVTYNGLNRKRQVIDNLLEDLHNMQMQMIEEALSHSKLSEANDVINHIKEKL
jgi:hypothetical protein